MSKIEAELVKATGVKPKAKEDRQDFLDRLIKKVQDLPDDEWEGLSEAGQKWVNAGAKAVNADKAVAEFPDAAKKKAEAADDDDADDRTTRKSRRAAADDDGDGDGDNADDDADDKPARSKRRGADDDDDADEKPARRSRARDDDADGDDAGDGDGDADGDGEGDDDVAKKRAAKKGGRTPPKVAKGGRDAAVREKARAEKGKPSRRGGGDAPKKRGGAQDAIKRAIIKDPSATSDGIAAMLAKKGLDVTASAVSTIRSGTLQTLRLVKELGMPKGIE